MQDSFTIDAFWYTKAKLHFADNQKKGSEQFKEIILLNKIAKQT